MVFIHLIKKSVITFLAKGLVRVMNMCSMRFDLQVKIHLRCLCSYFYQIEHKLTPNREILI